MSRYKNVTPWGALTWPLRTTTTEIQKFSLRDTERYIFPLMGVPPSIEDCENVAKKGTNMLQKERHMVIQSSDVGSINGSMRLVSCQDTKCRLWEALTWPLLGATMTEIQTLSLRYPERYMFPLMGLPASTEDCVEMWPKRVQKECHTVIQSADVGSISLWSCP